MAGKVAELRPWSATLAADKILKVLSVISPQDEMVCEIYFIIILWRRRHKTKTTT